MLRITTSQQGGHRTKLTVEGSIVGGYAELLEAECTRTMERGEGVVLDLTSVSYVDARGVATLLALFTAGVEAIECSPFVKESIARFKPR